MKIKQQKANATITQEQTSMTLQKTILKKEEETNPTTGRKEREGRRERKQQLTCPRTKEQGTLLENSP